MKIQSLIPAAALLFAAAAANASDFSSINPVPRQAEANGTAFATAGATYRLTGSATADPQAVAALQKSLNCADGGTVEIVIGEAGDDAVAAVAAKIPEQAQGYYLSTAAGKVIIAGRDGDGTFYGVQSFLQLAEGDEVAAGEITDYPANAIRGVIEGFYGNPWSFDKRVSQFEFYGRHKMNIYVYGPKDDVYHRNRCYELYPEAEAEQMGRLVQSAIDNKVEFVWAMHPGNDIDENRYEAAKAKFEQLYGLGVRRFALFFDDIDANSVQAQIDYLNWIDTNFVKAHEGTGSLIVCPTQYNIGFAGGWGTTSDYLPKMGTGLHSDIEIMWTGSWVVDTNLKDSSVWFAEKTGGRKPFIWLNYPVNDYGGQSLMMGPYPAAATDIDQYTTAFCSNPMQYAEASKVGLFSIADFSWNPTAYDRAASWEKALAELQPDHTDAFRTFCRNNIYYHNCTHGLVMPDDETPDFKAIVEAGREITDANADALTAFFTAQESACTELLGAAEGDPLLTEIKEWIQSTELQGKRGRKIMEMYAALHSETPADFIELYKAYTELTAEADELISYDFEGSIRKVHPTTGMQYVEPWITVTVANLADEFKALGIEYPDGLFPARIIESGDYFILFNGRYMTNKENSDRPSFVADRDEFTPNTQVWTIKYDTTTGRYSILSAQDLRYVNEKGEFGTNEFIAAWNTYDITPLGGFYAIQNGGSAGTNFWEVKSNRIQKGANTTWNVKNFMFRIVPVSQEVTDAPAGFAEGDYTICTPEGDILTRSTNTLDFRAPSETVKSTQKWTISVDSETNRVKIANGTRYINEKGVIGTNQYYASWNSYELYELNGRFAIRNGGDAGTNFWFITDSKTISNRENSLVDAFNFVITPVDGKDSITEITGAPAADENSVYDLQGRRVARPGHGLYIVNGKKVIL